MSQAKVNGLSAEEAQDEEARQPSRGTRARTPAVEWSFWRNDSNVHILDNFDIHSNARFFSCMGQTRGKFSKCPAAKSNFWPSCVNWLLNYQPINWPFLAVVVGDEAGKNEV